MNRVDSMTRGGFAALMRRVLFAALVCLLPCASPAQSSEAMMRQVTVLLDSGRGAQALEVLKAVVAKDPKNAEAFNGLGNLYMAKGDMQRASESYWKAVELQPRNADFRNNLGVFDGRIGRDATAMDCFLYALKLNPNHRGALLNAGDFLLRAGRVDEALGYFDRVLKNDPADADVHYRKGALFRSLGDLAGAAKEYGAAVTARPEFADARTDLALTYLELKEPEKALRHFQVVVSQQPGLVRAIHGEALCWKALGKTDAAVAGFSRAARMEPENADHFVELAFALAEQKKPETTKRAEVMMRGALKLVPGDLHANFMAGVFYDNLGRPADAAPFYARAVALGHRNPQAKLFLAEDYLKLGRRLSAELLLKELVTGLPAGDPMQQRAKALLGAS